MYYQTIFNMFTYGIAMVIGACIGIGVSFIVNCTLIEISKSIYFSYYFAFFFLIIGIYILIRSIRSYHTTYQNPDYIQLQQKDKLRYQYLILLGCLLIISAVFSFALHNNTIQKMNYIIKIPIFSCLGIAVTFSLSVTIIDIINSAFHLIQSKDTRPPLNSSRQIIPIIIISCVMGMAFGTIFGVMDMEDIPLRFLKQLLVKEENYCIPIGIICGALCGLFAAMIDNIEGAPSSPNGEFKPLSQDDEIEV